MMILYFMTMVIRREDYLRTNSVLLWQLIVTQIHLLLFMVMESHLLHVSLNSYFGYSRKEDAVLYEESLLPGSSMRA